MKIQDAEKLAKDHIKNILGDGWKFRWDRSKKRFGCCHWNMKLITLSKELVELNEVGEVEDTILHEIAHALAGARHGHDKVWKQKCIEIGARPEMYYSTKIVTQPEPRYLLICNNCGRVKGAYKKRNCSCGKCSGGVYNPNYRMDCIPFKDCPSKYRTLYYLSR